MEILEEQKRNILAKKEHEKQAKKAREMKQKAEKNQIQTLNASIKDLKEKYLLL